MSTIITDLDKTLIYSNTEGKEKVVCVESRSNGKPITYMTQRAVDILNDMIDNYKTTLIPCTLRSKEQVDRVKFVEKCPIIICDNGGTIYYNGEIDTQWDNIVANNINKDELAKIFDTISKYIADKGISIYRLKNNRYCFISAIFNTVDDADRYACVIRTMIPKGYIMHKQGKKIYYIPKWLDKEKAMKYVVDKYNIKDVITAGDSSVDENFVKAGNKCIVPAHATFDTTNCVRTMSKGIMAGEELLSMIKSSIVQRSEQFCQN